jgi:hypothetical protein
VRLGKHQLRLLATMASPFVRLIVPDSVARSLEVKGLVEPTVEGSFYAITPLGLRELADQLERGNLEVFLCKEFRQDRVRIFFKAEENAEGRNV